MSTRSTRREARPGSAARASVSIDEAPAEAATRVLAWGIGLVAALRLVVPFLPSMALWSMALPRFVPPAIGWLLTLIAALAALPPLANLVTPAWTRFGDAIARHKWVGAALAAALGLVLALLPDRTWFVGDFLIRRGAAIGNIATDILFPQALPLDLFLHHTLTGILANLLSVGPESVERILGALEGALLILLAARFARTLGLRGAAAATCVAVAALGGCLGLFTGYAKSLREMVVVAAAVATFGASLARDGRGAWGLALSLAAGFALHRSSLALIPAAAVAWIAAFRRKEPDLVTRILTIALPALVLASVAPEMIAAMRRFDALHLAPAGGGAGGALAAALAPLHLLDLLNVVFQLVPLALALLVPSLILWRPLARRPEAAVLLALLIPQVLALLFVHPRQGVFRDWDDFAAFGAALSFTAAWLVSATLAAAPRFAWCGIAAALGTVAPTTLWLIHAASPDAGIARVEASLAGPPFRPEMERALAWDFIGSRSYALGHADRTADAYERAAAIAPSPRLLLQWAVAERERGQSARARMVIERLIERAPDMPQAWGTRAELEWEGGDRAAARRDALHTLELAPGYPGMTEILRATEAPVDSAQH